MEREFFTTYTADPSDPYLVCGVEECQVPFRHAVGITEDRKWQHVWADLYYPVQMPTVDS